MLPSILAKQLEKGIRNYIETSFPMSNAPFKGSIRNMLQTKDSVYHEPYVSVRLPFRVAETMPTCFKSIHPAYLPYVHQQTAFNRLTGDDGRSTLIATGTGSGKTECFLYPILEYCYRHRGEQGVKALIIYPMNALATDQAKRIAELIWSSPELKGNVTAGMYVGGLQQNPSRMMSEDNVITDHETMLGNPPDILLTNYKMLDYLLVRPKDAALWKKNNPDTMKYIAVDELHTFDGAQGTDLACLLRRLKSRLWTPGGYLCCIGTSATMGSKDNGKSILQYAEEIFGEPFEEESIVTEDRLSPDEFFKGQDITDFTIPSAEQIAKLSELVEQDNEEAYLREATSAWTNLNDVDVISPEGRIALGKHLMHHSFMQAMITLIKGKYHQVSTIIEKLEINYPDLKKMGNAETAINALLALISHARSGKPNSLRPFLNVQVQLWIRELRRLVAKVSGSEVTYSIAHDLNSQQAKQYLPVVNCRDCGATGWTSILNEQMNATINSLESFYNLFFKTDDKIVMMFPHAHDNAPSGMVAGRICPSCLQLKLGKDSPSTCDSCGTNMVDVILPSPIQTTGSKSNKQFVCPFCGSKRGLSIMGLRSATEISTELSLLFASKFNDDKKTLAFSDNVQDAAHRAGFFNARTWRFGFKTAIQRYVQNGGANLSLADFSKGFIKYWHEQLNDESFVSFFIAPNMTWMSAYEDMLKKRKFGRDARSKKLMDDIEKRISYEIMLEYGLSSRIGRTLEKSGCSCLSFPSDTVLKVADLVHERVINELGGLGHTGAERYVHMVAGYLKIMAQNGAFADNEAFSLFWKENGNTYLISNDRISWMPGRKSGRNTPRFIYRSEDQSKKNPNFDTIAERKYTDWIAACCDEIIIETSTYTVISRIILEELVKDGIVVSIPATAGYTVYALDKNNVFISDNVIFMKCDTCGTTHVVSAENKEFWEKSSCIRNTCAGSFVQDESSCLGYYGKLFSSGDIVRINAREHTGLLERDDRESLEFDFKRKKDTMQIWDPNVLSCTPTLEMGIDIGDLSTVILCSMPPAQSQFLQRTGRAGRKDGNALTLAVAAAKPHDLYFYADPLDMMEGSVVPPKIFLKASAVLERQFVAYCMDSWVKRVATEQSIPKNVSFVLGKLEKHPVDVFPFNFLNYAQNNLSHLLNSFIQLFAQFLDDTARNELKTFAQGDKLKESPMHMRILEAFNSLKNQKDSLTQSIKQLKDMVKELEAKPKDSSYDEEIKELKAEQTALLNVVKEINKKDIFNFLSDEGLLPNYAFPESGIVLKAVLYRKDDETEKQQTKNKYKKSVYEYSRSASAAISEFAPNNSFYVDGRKLTVDQVDLTSAQSAKWRLCPNCSHAQIEEAGKNTSCCPRCGSPAWADAGQVRNMLKVQMVYSNMDYTKSLISDDNDDRSNVFYCKQLLVDVDEDHDISSAYQMDNEEFSFGYEFVKKATLREINFGESDVVGEKLTVSGVEDVRKGFKICKYCGKIQPEQGKSIHTFYCKTRKMQAFNNDPFEECLFLYREFATEALRILIPATTMDSSTVRTESFTAAFMLGMKEYFGNVDHLRATVSEVPVPDADYRKQYLVIYDSVPGGTGYLKQLMNEQGSLIDIFERALQKLEQCSCKEDPQKDGCYHCLYAYRQSQNIGNISRSTAIRILKSILSGKDNLAKIEKLGNIPVNSLFDSELERRFIEAIAQMGNENRKVEISKSLVNDKEGYILKVNGASWEIEPQVTLGPLQGVSIQSKPDFIIRQIGRSDKLPIAIFTDGFIYHKDKVADDTLKREAIRRSGRYRVWSLSWRDVQSVFQTQGDYATRTLAHEKMPSGAKMYQPTVGKADVLKPGKMSTFELLMRYLDMDDAQDLFEKQARAYSLSLLEPSKAANSLAFVDWNDAVCRANSQVHFTEEEFVQPGTFFGTWVPRSSDSHFYVYAGILASRMKVDKNSPVTVLALLDDRADSRTDKYEQEWNGFWQFFNVMQFSKSFVAVCSTGLDNHAYIPLPYGQTDTVAEDTAPSEEPEEGWDEIRKMLFDDTVVKIADALEEKGIIAPEKAGYELADDSGEVIAEVELAWIKLKIGFMTEAQMVDREKAENAGWKIFINTDEIDTIFNEVVIHVREHN
ncbi:DEAD/DEAH box helicase [Ruminobacter sp. RM87]|uniref:DEAD/DEAH box helicase n=1 Tax=Ruminobacter sp. RM87 TaxID=1200567 RepID=UPI000689404E|nr:DEAD/DEAH box helicase [Ruminobacter sp. RM87]